MSPEHYFHSRHSYRLAVVMLVAVSLGACSATPELLKRKPKPAPEPVTSTPVDVQVTPRELLTAKLVNPPANDNTPPVTVGKLIEFADRYLSCDCSGTRFVKSWQRLPDGYRLQTNSDLIRPLDFACRTEGELTRCYLTEIDRGAHVPALAERFVPGSEFIRFMYESGLKCEREGPCPVLESSAQAPP